MKAIWGNTALVAIALASVLTSCKKDDDVVTDNTSDDSYYYPANWSANWETVDHADLDWNTSALPNLEQFLDESDTRAFIVLVKGKIALEYYFGNALNGQEFGTSSQWYWASAGKSLVGFAAGVAKDKGYLNFQDPVSDYLGTGWTSATSAQEDAIAVEHMLTMTSGLNDGVTNPDCTDPSCLEYTADAGTRWAYHNGVYTKSHDLLAAATGLTFEEYMRDSICGLIGISGAWYWLENNHVFISNARSMARFGLLNLSKGKWGDRTFLSESTFTQLTSTSQALNNSYGYLYWLNGQSSYMIPQSQVTIPGSMVPEAPDDMYSALGKNSQIVSMIPSMDMVVVRMGNDPGNYLVPIQYQRDLWEQLNAVLNR